MKRSHLILWIPCVLYYSLITALSHIPGNSERFHFMIPFEQFDKVVHFGLYFFLGIILTRALSWEEYYRHLKKRWYIYFVFIILPAALLDEIHQHFVPFRNMDPFDLLADISGGVFGASIYFYVLRGVK